MSKQSKTTQFATEALVEFTEGANVLKTLDHVPMDQKLKALKLASSMLGQTFDLTYLTNLRDNCRKIELATKFRLPFNGHLMEGVADDKSFAYVVKNYLNAQRLPFPLISLEYSTDHIHNQNTPCRAVVLLAEELERPDQLPLIKLKVFKKVQLRDGRPYAWSNLKYEYIIDFEKICSQDDDSFDFITILEWELTDKATYSKLQLIHSELQVFLEFLLALSCKNLEVRKSYPPSLKENKYREKKGLPQYPQYNEIVINVGSSSPKDKSLNTSSSNTNKSPHLRRGHIRRLEGKIVWVSSTVVNSEKSISAVGVKSYRVKRH